MYCQNCGSKINDNDQFCSNCGNRIVSESKTPESEQSPSTFSESMKEHSQQLNKKIKERIVSFFNRYKKQIIISSCSLFILIIGLVLFNNLYGFVNFSWNKNYKDYQLEYVSPTTIKLGFHLSDQTDLDAIKIDTTCGNTERDGTDIEWDLKESTGKCEIVVSYKLRKLKKEFQIINFNSSEEELLLEEHIDPNSDEDLDLDGLTNREETEYQTNLLSSDSDLDGLDDYYEINVSKTDPNKKDTDTDGLSDYDEIELNLDPLNSDSKQDGMKDGERTLTYTKNIDNISLTITGTGNIASSIIETQGNTKISEKNGLIDKLYSLYTAGTINNATITINYTDQELKQYGLNEDTLSIFYYNESTSQYEKIDTVQDKEKNTLTATLDHFSYYVVGDANEVQETSSSQVLFILDNSWSMYSNEQYEEITGKEYSGEPLDGFDKEGLRFQLTGNLIDRLGKKNYQIGLSEFRSDYKNAVEIGNSIDNIKETLNSMNGNFITSTEGTNINNALTKGMREFSDDSDNKYIVILTDGQDTELSESRIQNIIETATKNDIKICTVGFGDASYNVALSNIANGTGCKFYSSSNALGLTELFESISAELDDNLVDLNGDSEVDGILSADSGFVVNRDGFSFPNYGTNLSGGGHCYGMATFAELYYKKVLPLKMDTITLKNVQSYPYDLNGTYFENYSNLYDYKLQTNLLKYTFGHDYFGEETPSDLRTLSDTRLLFNEVYKNEIEAGNMYDIIEAETSLSPEQQLAHWGVNYESAESLQLNEDKMQESSTISNDDLQLFNAIYAGFIRQQDTVEYSSGMDIILWLRNALETEEISYNGRAGFINILTTRLNNKEAPVISSSYTGGFHAINAISLIQSTSNPNEYSIGVYDNNYPGEKRYVKIVCNDTVCLTEANEYYSNSGQPIRITPSLEYDLAYYNQ